MKATITIIYFCVALLPSIIDGCDDDSYIDSSNNNPCRMSDIDGRQEQLNQARARLDKMVTNGENISKIFKPSKFLGRGVSSITYKGELLRIKKTIAMKFAPSTRNDLQIEYRMYSYLNAIDNSTVENYGIPAVYYYGEWGNYEMIAITLLDSRFNDLRSAAKYKFCVLDILIICREFVRTSKYVHSHGVFHKDCHLGNMMFRGNKGFMIDFDEASNAVDWLESDFRKEDWRNFLYNVCKLYGLNVDPRMCSNIVSKINEVRDERLERVLLKFAEYPNDDTDEPVNYDEVHDIITEEIREQRVVEPALVSWLKHEQKRQALSESEKNSTPDIRSIADPYRRGPFVYARPNYNYFVNQSE